MPRKGFVKKREIAPDSKYNDLVVAKLINCIMREGKKSIAERIVYDAFEEINKKTNTFPLTVFKQAMENCKPSLEVKARRVGGQNYQIPIEVPPARRTALALSWITDAAKARAEKTMKEKLASEVLDASKNAGAAVKKKEDTHKMAEANKAFVHFRW
jgi:small subunit ribosomal protein S7